MNLLNIVGRNKYTKRIFWKPEDSDGFVYPIVLKIREDSSDSLNLLEIASRNESTIRVFENLGNKSKQISSCRICFVEPETNLFGVRICDNYTKWIHGFAKRIHVFTNLLYDSRILRYNYKNVYFWNFFQFLF